MENSGDKLAEILARTERELLDELAEAARSGDLEAIDLTRWAVGQVRQVSARLCPPSSVEESSEPNSKPKKGQSGASSTRYPRFSIRGETLFRVGWSKRKHGEYEQKVPKATVDTIANSMARSARKNGRPVTVEEVLNKVNQSSPIQIPQYQVYLVVGWLRSLDSIEQIGRDGYRIPSDIAERITVHWARQSDE